MSPDADVRATSSPRIASIDILRGIVVVLMAIDHVRVYSGLPAGGPTAGIFFTRWITHFCAPVFVFLAGTGAFLNGRKVGTAALSRYLLSRGLLLVVLELTLIRFFWSFNLRFGEFALAGVIWMLGWCMVLLALLVRWSPRTVGITGVAIIVFQQLFALPGRFLPANVAWLWGFIYPAGSNPPESVVILYVLVPWIGVMAAGYGFGALLVGEASRRRQLLLSTGSGMTAAFIIVGTALVLMRPPMDGTPPLFALLNQRKYPASVLFLLMTLGPAIAVLPALERAQGWLARALTTFGRVPMFYYLLHIPLIHASALVVGLVRDGAVHAEWYAHAPYTWMPPASQWSLSLLYAVYGVDLVLLYAACKWFEGVKKRGGTRALHYL